MTDRECIEFLTAFLEDKPDFRVTHPGQAKEVYEQMDMLEAAIRKSILALEYLELRNRMNDCNDCGHINCGHDPDPGELVRINCPLWMPVEEVLDE